MLRPSHKKPGLRCTLWPRKIKRIRATRTEKRKTTEHHTQSVRRCGAPTVSPKGAHSGDSDRRLIRKQAAWKLVHIVSKPVASTDRSSRTIPSEPGLLPDPLLVAARTAGARVHELESSSAFSFSQRKPACVRNGSPEKTHLVENFSAPSDVRQLSRNCVKYDWKDEETNEAVDCGPTRHAGLATIPSSFLPSGSALRLSSPSPTKTRPDYWRSDLLYRGGDTERHPGLNRALLLRGRDVLLWDVPPQGNDYSYGSFFFELN